MASIRSAQKSLSAAVYPAAQSGDGSLNDSCVVPDAPQAVVSFKRWRWSGNTVVGLLLFVSLVIGVLAYRRFVASDRFLAQQLREIGERGHALSAEQCVDEVLARRDRCEAMKSMCNSTVPDMMDRCLGAKDRAAACQDWGAVVMSTRFGFDACAGRRLSRDARAACATSYRVIATHCERLGRGQ